MMLCRASANLSNVKMVSHLIIIYFILRNWAMNLFFVLISGPSPFPMLGLRCFELICLSSYHLQFRFDSWVRKIPWRRNRLPTPVFLGFPCGSAGKESACNVGNLGSIRGLGRSPGEGKGNPFQYSCLENPMD